ncbi:hypothetical protein [Streptomyces sp. NBC_01207]|uniref:hypothetical protein n=1 Tax=Streptomyces sp. NBC_01207 TaxID=2903772 RepID=UPI002E13B140|nr:hypothetical protein OG457_48110 [Streptomyces sp. NBC_01207]
MIDRTDIGERVQDGYGRTGIQRDIDPAWEVPSDPPGRRRQVVAFISPERGGREWHADPPRCNGCENRLALSRRAGLRGAGAGHEPVGGR